MVGKSEEIIKSILSKTFVSTPEKVEISRKEKKQSQIQKEKPFGRSRSGSIKNKTKSSILGLVLVLTILVAQSNLIPKLFYPYPYKQIINKYAIEYNTDSLLVVSVIKAESSFLPFSSSDKGAIGLMQLMPDTAREISQKLGEDYAAIDLKDPETNIRYGSMYLAGLSKQYDGNTVLTLAAYNAGSGRVKEWLKTTGLGLDNYSVKDIPFPETRTYVEKVLKYHQEYSKLY